LLNDFFHRVIAIFVKISTFEKVTFFGLGTFSVFLLPNWTSPFAKCWADHTLLTVPLEPNRHRVWRVHNSKKPLPTKKRWKSKTNVPDRCGQTLSKLVFSARKVRRKRCLNGEKTLGYRYETFAIDEDGVKKQIEEIAFDFMAEEDATHPVCQDGLRGWIEEKGYRSPGFASAPRDHANGYPPNSSDGAVLGRFKVLVSEACPKSIPEAIRVATASNFSG
jgi:hypothetical protein